MFEFFLKEKGYVRGRSRGRPEQTKLIAEVNYQAFYDVHAKYELTDRAMALLNNPPTP